MGGLQAQPVTPIILGFPGAVKIKTPLNRELVATYEVTISVHDNASEVIDRSVSVPNGKRGLLPGSTGLGLRAAGGWHSLSGYSFWVAGRSPTSLSTLTSNISSGSSPGPAPSRFGFSSELSFSKWPRYPRAALGMERAVCP